MRNHTGVAPGAPRSRPQLPMVISLAQSVLAQTMPCCPAAVPLFAASTQQRQADMHQTDLGCPCHRHHSIHDALTTAGIHAECERGNSAVRAGSVSAATTSASRCTRCRPDATGRPMHMHPCIHAYRHSCIHACTCVYAYMHTCMQTGTLCQHPHNSTQCYPSPPWAPLHPVLIGRR